MGLDLDTLVDSSGSFAADAASGAGGAALDAGIDAGWDAAIDSAINGSTGFDWAGLGGDLLGTLATGAVTFGVNYGTAALLGGSKATQTQVIHSVVTQPAQTPAATNQPNNPGAGYSGSTAAGNQTPTVIIQQPAPASAIDSKTLMLAGGIGILLILLMQSRR